MKKMLFLIILLVLLGCGREKVEVDLNRPLVVFGDSLTTGYGSSKGFTEHLKENLHLKVIPLGVTGDTTYNALKRVDEVKSHDPSIVIIELGRNDFLRRVPTRATKMNLAKIIEELDDGKRIIFLMDFYPENNFFSFFLKIPKKEYDNMFKELSKGENVYLIENMWKDVWKKEMSDEIHPNSRGYEIMGQNILKDMKKVLNTSTFKNDI